MKNLLLVKNIILLFAFLMACNILYATHYRAGEILYERIDGLSYKFSLVVYLKKSSLQNQPQLDVCDVEMSWSDGTTKTAFGGCSSAIDIGGDVVKKTYVVQHTFAGVGVFKVYFQDKNRNDRIVNIPDLTPFYVESEIVISPILDFNNSPELLNPPIDDACVNNLYYHNPAAVDNDGDDLTYELVKCQQDINTPIPGYFIPSNMSINPITGTVVWDKPTITGEFNIAILIKEYRNGVFIGSVLRDMQITVIACNNNPPKITPEILDTCVIKGQNISIKIQAWEDDFLQNIKGVTYEGDAFELANTNASFTYTGNTQGGNPIVDTNNYIFSWTPNCNDVRTGSYKQYFIARDNFNPSLTAISNVFIKVVAPGPENLSVVPFGSDFQLNWDKSECSNAIGYRIYRRINSSGFIPSACETGVPSYTGYDLIQQNSGYDNNSYLDENLNIGVEYCYFVIAVFPDGSESIVGDEVCNSLKLEAPVVLNVSVVVTDILEGKDTIRWSSPRDIDTVINFTGPYKYRLYREINGSGNEEMVFESNSSNFLGGLDTIYVDTALNTKSNYHTYRVSFLNNEIEVSNSVKASSIYLSLTPSDNKITLNWLDNTPWSNDSVEIYRLNNSSGSFELIGLTTQSFFEDDGLENGQEYCYYAKTIGSYNSAQLPQILRNNSQEVCGAAIDLEAPCPPNLLEVNKNCILFENGLKWDNPNYFCEDTDDVIAYKLYYTAIEGENYELIDSNFTQFDTTYLHLLDQTVAGCYVVTAIDSFYNESLYSNSICIENCYEFEMPNVFTPNDDGINDLYLAIKYDFVKSINLKIINRWGNEIFASEDVLFTWDGKNSKGKLVTNGVYFYTVEVTFVTLNGDLIENKSGTIYINY